MIKPSYALKTLLQKLVESSIEEKERKKKSYTLIGVRAFSGGTGGTPLL